MSLWLSSMLLTLAGGCSHFIHGIIKSMSSLMISMWRVTGQALILSLKDSVPARECQEMGKDVVWAGSFPYSPSRSFPDKHHYLSFLLKVSCSPQIHGTLSLTTEENLLHFNFPQVTTRLIVPRYIYLDPLRSFYLLQEHHLYCYHKLQLSRPLLSHNTWSLTYWSIFTDKLDLKMHKMLYTVVTGSLLNQLQIYTDINILEASHLAFQRIKITL